MIQKWTHLLYPRPFVVGKTLRAPIMHLRVSTRSRALQICGHGHGYARQVLLLAGPDKGKTGFMIGVESSLRADIGQSKAIIKLETNTALGGISEIKVR